MRPLLALLAAALAPAAASALPVRTPDGAPTTPAQSAAAGLTVVWVAHADLQPLAEPKAAAAPSDAPALKYMERLFVAGRRPTDKELENENKKKDDKKDDKNFRPVTAVSGGTTYWLLVRIDARNRIDTLVGWVDERVLVKGSGCLTRPESRLLRKAMVVNSVDMVKAGKGRAEYFSRPPAPNDRPTADVAIFQVYFVYGETEPDEEKSGALLLGTAPLFSPEAGDEIAKTVIGWMKKDRLCQWDSREGVDFEPLTFVRERQKVPVRVYKEKGDAEKALKHTGPVDESKVLLTEPEPEGNTLLTPEERLRKYVADRDAGDAKRRDQAVDIDAPAEDAYARAMRFPVLDTFTTDGRNRLLKVGVVGDFYGGGGVIAKERIAAMTKQLNDMEQFLGTIDIVFVLCNGNQMADWARQMMSVAEHIAKTRALGQKVRVAVVVYGDTANTVKHLLPFTDVSKPSDAAEVAQVFKKFQMEVNTKVRSQVWKGLEEAGGLLRRSNPFTRKLVVLCGHFGNETTRTDADEEAAAAKFLEAFAPDKAEAPVDLLAVQMMGKENGSENTEAFARQANLIGAKLTKYTQTWAFPSTYKFARVDRDGDVKPAAEAVTGRYNAVRDEQKALLDEVNKLRRGENRVFVGGRPGPVLKKLLEGKITEAELLKLGAGAQVFDIGYVWEKTSGGVAQMRPFILVNGADAEVVAKAVEKMEDSPPNTSFPDLLETAAREVYLKQTGEPNFKQGAERILDREMGLKFRSDLFRLAIGPLPPVVDVDQEKARQSELQRVYYHRKLLDDVRTGKAFLYREEKKKVGAVEGIVSWSKGEQSVRDQARSFPLGEKADAARPTRQQWYWIDFTREWP